VGANSKNYDSKRLFQCGIQNFQISLNELLPRKNKILTCNLVIQFIFGGSTP